jgi:uncharacterized protein YggE
VSSERRAEDVTTTAPTVSVVGEAAIRTQPDEAFLSVTLSAVHESPGPALADVAKRSESLAKMLDELGMPREDRSTTGVTVAEEFDHTPQGRRSLGHRATASTSVRLADPALIGRVLMRSSGEVDARIAGPSWRVSQNHPAWLEAASQAAANAKTKAAAYAAGVDARLGPLLKLSEPGDSYGMPQAVRAAAAFGDADMHVDAGQQEVTASIHATFALDLG